jgi:Bacterial membrane protein YfhO
MRIPRPFAIGAVSLAFTYLYFVEYLPPLRRVHIPYDLDGYHYPLMDYAFGQIRQGRIPQWDATTYSGMSFVANVQAALFYPPAWVLFAAKMDKEHLSYQSLQEFIFVHVWLAFLLCYLWLRGKRLNELACVLGAGVYAYSGYLMEQLQHQGLVTAYSWFPLGLWGIDQAVERKSFRPLWKLALASALAFLAGYPPTWFVFAVLAMAYAAGGEWRARAMAGSAAALVFSMGLAAVQALPAAEASAWMVKEQLYGTGHKDPWDYLPYVIPNFFDYGAGVDPMTNPGRDYLYLGAPGLAGLLYAMRRSKRREMLPAIAVAAASLILVTNPFDLIWAAIRHSTLLAGLCRSWYFFAGLTLAAACLAAYGLDTFLSRSARPVPKWLHWSAPAALGAWTAVQIARYLGPGFPAGWATGLDAAVMLALFGASLFVYRARPKGRRAGLALLLALAAGIEYKVFGTVKRFNGSVQPMHLDSEESFFAMDTGAYRELQANREHRILLDEFGPFPGRLRRLRLSTPQGFDPLLTNEYRAFVERHGKFRDNRLFDVDIDDEAALNLFGVRYVITAPLGPLYPRLQESSRFRRMGLTDPYFKVFEYLGYRPPYGWENGEGTVELHTWEPEFRKFTVRSAEAGRFALHEQFYPGWTAWIDGRAAAIERWNGAFQAIQVPAGEHTVEFRFRSRWLGLGAWISLASLGALVLWGRGTLAKKRVGGSV